MKKSTKSTSPAAPQAKKTATKKAVGTKKAATKKAAAAPTLTPAVEAAPAKAPKKTVAKKTAAKPPVAAKKPAAKKAPAAKASASKTVITAKIDIGFGNTLHVRGSGPGLSWDGGVPLNCAADDEWSITLTGATSPVVFKFLVNDLSWSSGEDYVVEPGSSVVIEPSF